MTTQTHRQVAIERIANSRYTVTNERGGQITIGSGGGTDRALLPDAVKRSHESLCTVSRTVELGTPIAWRVE